MRNMRKEDKRGERKVAQERKKQTKKLVQVNWPKM
jgi:hypothetical protein